MRVLSFLLLALYLSSSGAWLDHGWVRSRARWVGLGRAQASITSFSVLLSTGAVCFGSYALCYI
ncbi:uncharacterized protein BKA78DRAFT_302043 [Phyllosticta capitalensis]|uniref:uncharacterized protein n=1 Tax=Phyllosticta capitalensis TaxID=121624 RepID=UPI0031303A3D